MVKAPCKQGKDRESRRKWRERLTGGGKGSGHCIGSGFECAISEAQDEDKVLGCRGGNEHSFRLWKWRSWASGERLCLEDLGTSTLRFPWGLEFGWVGSRLLKKGHLGGVV